MKSSIVGILSLAAVLAGSAVSAIGTAALAGEPPSEELKKGLLG